MTKQGERALHHLEHFLLVSVTIHTSVKHAAL